MASNTRYRGRNWDEVEPDLRANYATWSRERGYSETEDAGIWEKIKDLVAQSWNRAVSGVDETPVRKRAADRPAAVEQHERGYWMPWRGEYSGSMHADRDETTRGDSLEP